jgi:hypothetical protein
VTELDEAVVVWYLASRGVEELVLEDENGIVVPDRRPQEAVGIGRGARDTDLQPRDV